MGIILNDTPFITEYYTLQTREGIMEDIKLSKEV